jgi:hypothetical protein
MNRKPDAEDEMPDEYDFTAGVRGKSVERPAGGKNVIAPEAAAAEVATGSASVKQALRGLLPIIRKQAEKIHQ